MEILIVGYGNIGKHIREEFKALNPDIYDPFLPEYSVKKNKRYDFAFICVPTESLSDGACDTSIVERALKETDAEIIVIKSTVPPGTTGYLIQATGKQIIFSPEHYGVTQHCKSDPGFVILGGEKEMTAKVAQLYGIVKNGYCRFHFTDTKTAELSKYMHNAFLALKVMFCNEFADVANKLEISYPELRELFVTDERVGCSHTIVYPEQPFYDSHCFNKDIPALIRFSDGAVPLMTFTDELNRQRKQANALYGLPPVRSASAFPVTAHKYECSICLIVRDENEYLEEWLNWHIRQGVQHFYIYDHGSQYPVTNFVGSLGGAVADKVTVIDWSGSHDHAQSEAYNDCLKRLGGESKWIGFIDADEQVRVKTGQTLPEFLKAYGEYAGLFAVWHIYDADGQRYKSTLPLRQRFKRINRHNQWENTSGKVFVQPSRMEDMYIHNGHTKNGFVVVGEYKDAVQDFRNCKDHPTTDLICIDHYYTKSYEEWLEKLRRGSCDSNFFRRYEEFFMYNPDLEYCREKVFPIQEYEVSAKSVRLSQERGTYYVCAIVKDEHEYIREWALHNQSIGFDKIVLYDNGSSKPYDMELSDLMRDGFVEVRPWHDSSDSRQINAYNDFVRNGRWTDHDYCAFIDPDEFIFFDDGKTVSEFVELYKDYSGVGLSWRTYNAGGRIESPNGQIPTPQVYTSEFEYWEPRIKMIGRLTDIEDIYSPHAFRPKRGRPPLVTTGGEEIFDQSPHFKDYTNGHIKHYITKSWQDWVKRLKRGNITKGLRGADTFFEFNPDMAHLKDELTKNLDFGQFPTI